MSKYLIVIHGGDSYNDNASYLAVLQQSIPRYRNNYLDWKANLQSKISPEYTLLQPNMPCKDNAKYKEWEIVMNKILSIIPEDSQLHFIGKSLGGNFLSIYLSRNTLKQKVIQLHLVAACLGEGDFRKQQNGKKITNQCDNIHIWHSADDPVVDFNEALEYSKLITNSILHKLEDRGHFNQADFAEMQEYFVE
jgi:predicted alpha/beta hydrolase family esterase